jgi:hypothetical protein
MPVGQWAHLVTPRVHPCVWIDEIGQAHRVILSNRPPNFSLQPSDLIPELAL